MSQPPREQPSSGDGLEAHSRALFYRAIIDASPHAVIVVSAQGMVQCWSRGAEQLFGFSEPEMDSRPIRSFWEGEIDPAAFSGAGVCHWDTAKRCFDGSMLDVSVESAPLHGPDGRLNAVVWTVRDIGERMRREREQRRREADLREDARTDALTRVSNRRGLLEALQAEHSRGCREGTSLMLVFVDLDDFKAINDEFGHTVGDQVLQAFVALVQSNLRAYDLLARWGGDEFVIMMPNTSRDEAVACVERIRELVQLARMPCLSRPLTASFGISAHGPGEALEAQFHRTDQALHRAKHSGKNCAVSDEGLVRRFELDDIDIAPAQSRHAEGRRRA